MSLFKPLDFVFSFNIKLSSAIFRLSSSLNPPSKMQNLRSEISWPGLLKCSATGNPREFCLTECKWLLKLNLNLVLVSPMYQECGHFVQYKAYTTFAELQLKLPGRTTHWFMVTVSSVSIRLHILHCGLLQGLLD